MKLKERLITHFESINVTLSEREYMIAEIGYLLSSKFASQDNSEVKKKKCVDGMVLHSPQNCPNCPPQDLNVTEMKNEIL